MFTIKLILDLIRSAAAFRLGLGFQRRLDAALYGAKAKAASGKARADAAVNQLKQAVTNVRLPKLPDLTQKKLILTDKEDIVMKKSTFAAILAFLAMAVGALTAYALYLRKREKELNEYEELLFDGGWDDEEDEEAPAAKEEEYILSVEDEEEA